MISLQKESLPYQFHVTRNLNIFPPIFENSQNVAIWIRSNTIHPPEIKLHKIGVEVDVHVVLLMQKEICANVPERRERAFDIRIWTDQCHKISSKDDHRQSLHKGCFLNRATRCLSLCCVWGRFCCYYSRTFGRVHSQGEDGGEVADTYVQSMHTNWNSP